MAMKRFKPYDCGGRVGGTSLRAGQGRHRAESLTFAGGHESYETDRFERIAAAPAPGAKRKSLWAEHSIPVDNSWDSKPQTEVRSSWRQTLRRSNRSRRFLRAFAQSLLGSSFEARRACIERRGSSGRRNAAEGKVLCPPSSEGEVASKQQINSRFIPKMRSAWASS